MLRLMDCVAPALLVAQAIGRVGNYFNQELFGKPSTLPWAVKIDPAHRPPHYLRYATFQPTFLYELVWNLALAGVLAWLVRSLVFGRPGCSLCTSPATRRFGFSRRTCGSTTRNTSSGCG